MCLHFKRIITVILVFTISFFIIGCKEKSATEITSSLQDVESSSSIDNVDETSFVEQNDQVTAIYEVNLRLSPTTSAEIVGVLINDMVLQRTAKSSTGWSRLIYNDQIVYAVTSYLTTDLLYKQPVDNVMNSDFEGVYQQVTAKSETNLRSHPSVTDSQIVYTLKNGEYVTRTGVSKNGWSRLEYNGQTVYAVSNHLSK